jgi:DNA-binding response OmpR family regulator
MILSKPGIMELTTALFSTTMRILLVEDDTLLSQIVADHLISQHYVVDIATDGLTGFDYALAVSYDLIVLDVNLPQLNGIQLCQQLRQNSYTGPILLLTAKGESADKVMGLDAGADDYVVKPCPLAEISARVRALLRRSNLVGLPSLVWRNLSLHPVTCEVTCDGQPLALSPKEYSLLELFLRNPQRVFSSASILENLWSFEDVPGEETIRSHIKRLRRKLKASGNDDLIETVYGMGYRLKLSDTPALPAPAPKPNTDATQNQAQQAVTGLWLQFKQLTLERLAVLDQAVLALDSHRLSPTLHTASVHAAHKLAGSLAMFGFPAGSQLGREIEQLLLASTTPILAQLKPLVHQLHEVIQAAEVSLIAPPPLPQALSLPLPVCQVQPSIAKLKLLLIDPDPALTQQFQREGLELGVQVAVAHSIMEARSCLALGLPDLILLAPISSLADSSELKFLDELQAQTPKPVVVLFTKQSDFTSRLAGLRQGYDRFISKSTPVNKILLQLRALHAQLSSVPINSSAIKVLAVDDDPIILAQLAQYLPHWGIQLTTSNHPTTLWQTLETVQPDLMILDVTMPTISGIEVCQLIRSDTAWSNLPILFLTSWSEPEAILQIYQAGADDYISKPFTDMEVVTRIFNRLARHRSTSLVQAV